MFGVLTNAFAQYAGERKKKKKVAQYAIEMVDCEESMEVLYLLQCKMCDYI